MSLPSRRTARAVFIAILAVAGMMACRPVSAESPEPLPARSAAT